MGFRNNELVEELPHIRRFAISLLKHGDRADDLVQDCIVRAMANRNSFATGTNLRSWLFTILHRLFVDTCRRGSDRWTTTGVPYLIDSARVEPRQGDKILLNEVASAVAELPSTQRYVILLIGMQGYSYGEAAEIVGVPVGTVRSRLSRARNALREMLSLDDQDGVDVPYDREKSDHRGGLRLTA